jgi:hypothetical protein
MTAYKFRNLEAEVRYGEKMTDAHLPHQKKKFLSKLGFSRSFGQLMKFCQIM